MPPRTVGTFKKSGGNSIASPDFRLSGRNSPSDPASINLEAATVRTLLIQLADFSLDFQSVKEECFVENETDTYSVDRAKVVALFQDGHDNTCAAGWLATRPYKGGGGAIGQFITSG